jgi:hypothetical protein
MQPSARARRTDGRDEGSVLVLALAFILLGALIITPMLSYATSVSRASRVQQSKTTRAEAVKAAFRVAMADPHSLYDRCAESGLHLEKTLAGPKLATPVTTVCTTVKNSTEADDTALRMAMTTVRVGTAAPVGTVGTPYPNSGNADTGLWWNDRSLVSAGGKILSPYLPAHALTHPASSGYLMPSWADACRVFFPGTYTDPITISDSLPVYFTSGIYYFENTVTFTGSADVVIGGGAESGCTSDQEAAWNAIGAPLQHNITGYGATFILGAAGKLVFSDTAVAGTGPNVRFNNRLVNDTDIASVPSRNVSVISVNGVNQGTTSAVLDIGGVLKVPASTTAPATDTDPPIDAMVSGYHPSTLVPAPPALTTPIIDISLTTANAARVWIPGYIAVPQGNVSMAFAPGTTGNKNVQLVGGVLAAEVTQTPDLPTVCPVNAPSDQACLQMGIVNRVVQKTFKIVSTSVGDAPNVVSTALVLVNDYGQFVVSSWEITIG